MVRHDVIHKRLRKLDGYLLILHRSREYSLEEFLDSPNVMAVLNAFCN